MSHPAVILLSELRAAVRFLFPCLLLFVAQLVAGEGTNAPKNINSSGCQCMVNAPLKVCAGKPFIITVCLLADKLVDKEYQIRLAGTAEAHFDGPNGTKSKNQGPCPSIGEYTVHPGELGARKIEVWVGTALCKEIEVVKLDLISLEFTTDYQVLRNKTDDFRDGGTVPKAPEWTKAGTNNPIVHGKAKKIDLKLTLQFDALTNDTHISEGKGGTNAWLHFGSITGDLKPGRNELTFTSEAALPDKILNQAGGSIDWKIAITPCAYDWTTGPHRIYVTAGEPYGSQVTEWRVNWVTSLCDGLTTGLACATRIHESGGKYELDEKPPLWKIAAGASGECLVLCKFYVLAMQMLGWRPAGEVHLLYAGLKKTVSVDRLVLRSPADPLSAWLCFQDGSGKGNKFEAVWLYEKNCFGGGAGRYDSYKELMQAVVVSTFWSNRPDREVERW